MKKFKPGDIVVCLEKKHCNETVGKNYIVSSEIHSYYGWFWVEKDDDNYKNCYEEKYFALARKRQKFHK